MATQKKTDVVRMWQNEDVLLIEVDLDSYHYRLSTDNRGCVAYGNVAASRRASGPNIHAFKMKSLNDSRFAMLSVGPAADPTCEDYSAFLEFQVVSPACMGDNNYHSFERTPALAPGCFSVYARPREDGLSVIIPRHSVGSTDLAKYAVQGRTVKLHMANSVQTMTNQITSTYETSEDIVLVFRDSISDMYESGERIVNMLLMFVDKPDSGKVREPTPEDRIKWKVTAHTDGSGIYAPAN